MNPYRKTLKIVKSFTLAVYTPKINSVKDTKIHQPYVINVQLTMAKSMNPIKNKKKNGYKNFVY